MNTEEMFNETEHAITVTLTYAADESLIRAIDLSEAIEGMAKCLRVSGRAANLDFEDVYITPLEHGSVKAIFKFIKRHRTRLIVTTVGGAAGMVLGTMILKPFELIGEYGLNQLKQPNAHIMAEVDKAILQICMNNDFRRGVTLVAKPINEVNENVAIKVNDQGYEINCDNQYKFTQEEDELILPELEDGSTHSLVGSLTRMNMKNNDLGFEHKGRTLSISPVDPEKHVAHEYKDFTIIPQVKVTGIVVRNSLTEVPKLRVIEMEEYLPPAQPTLFEGVVEDETNQTNQPQN